MLFSPIDASAESHIVWSWMVSKSISFSEADLAALLLQ